MQLMSASIWQVVQQRDAMNYAMLAEFVSLVTEMVPELLIYRQRAQLILGLRARVSDTEVESSETHFLELVQTLLKDPDEREHFFTEIFPVEYGQQYDIELQTLLWEFLSRLVQLLPTPDLAQTMAWLGTAPSVLDDCAHVVSHPADLKRLLQHHKRRGHLEQHVPLCAMGDCILSSLSIPPHSRTVISTEQTTCDNQSEPSQEFVEDTSPVLSVDDLQVEIVTLTGYAEVELGLCQEEVEEEEEEEVVRDGNDDEGQTMEDKEEETSAEEVEEEERVMEDHVEGGLESDSHLDEAEDDPASSQHQTSSGPHICSVCEKSFKFASALIAHQVIHTGERPYVCHLCGRCFSFRQSLDRHKQTHKDGRVYDCLICGETFQSLSARTEHKKSHMEQGAYQCSQCHRKFSWASAMVRHLKAHTEGAGVKTQELTKSLKSEKEDIGIEEIVREVAVETPEDGGKSPHNPQEGEEMVRTSGRKTRPTLKVQMVNLQKLKGKVATPKRRTDEASVQQHIETDHSGEVQEDSQSAPHLTGQAGHYDCPDCNSSYKFQSLLKYHRRVHTGERPYVCPQCGRRFSFKQSLERHKQTHKDGCKHDCLICGQNFKSLSAYTEHRKNHMENGVYRCSECDRRFSWKSALVRHLRTHTANATEAELSYKCTRCDLGFSSRL
ncbi:unnamed protein product [Coregonus sp. 'balchen']|nr:unnamed protein product [Coregonus sp. 'balchen']